MASQDQGTKFQFNFRAGNALINAYAADEAEADQALAFLREKADDIAALQGLLDAAANIAAPQTGQATPPQQAGNIRPNASAPSGDGGQCAHGSRVYKSGQGKRGEWKAWMCPSRVQGCDPVWID